MLERDIALIATIIFAVDPITVSAAIDVRSYAFAALATAASIVALVSLRHNSSTWPAALFGLVAGIHCAVPLVVRSHPARHSGPFSGPEEQRASHLLATA
jgi:uncharacterized membrane protein